MQNPLQLPAKITSDPPKAVRTCGVWFIFDFEMRVMPQRRAPFRHLNFGVVRTWGVFSSFTCRCASRRNSLHFFGISTSKKWCVLYMLILFDFEICFAPQWRALFRHPNFREWSEREAPLVYSLANVLRATMACNRSSLIWLDGSAPAALASRLFWTSHKSLERHTNFIDFPTFSRFCTLFHVTLSLLWPSLFYSSLLSGSSHLCFSSVHIVGSLTSKLSSINVAINPNDFSLSREIW